MKRLLIVAILLISQSEAQISINLYNGPNLMDGCAVFFDNHSDGIDLNDIRKINNPAENIAIIKGKDTLAGEKRATYSTINIRLWNLLEGNHTLSFKIIGINTAFLQDGNNYTHIKDGLVYPVTDSSYKIIFCPVLSIQPTIQQQQRQIIKHYIIYNVLGQVIYKGITKPVGALKMINETTFIKL